MARGEAPEWTVNPGGYNYNMTVYAKLRINNIFSADPEDKIAAFADGKCIGVAHVDYEERNDMWYAFLTLYSNETNREGLVFKIWDASTGMIYLADAGKTINFANNSTVGTPANPQIFDGGNMVFQDIDLLPGWNWISFNVQSPAMNSLNEVLSELEWDASNFFKSEADNLSANYSAVQGKWMEESPVSLGNKRMYKVSSSLDQTLSLAGTKIKPSAESLDIIGNRWNYISYLPSVRLKLDEALAGYEAGEEDIIKTQEGFAMYSGNIGWVGSLTYMKPGKGYMLFRNDPAGVTMKFPDSSGSMSEKSGYPETVNGYVNTDFAGNMNVIAVSDVEPQENDRILTYIDRDLSSETAIGYANGQFLYFITVAGNANRPVTFALERNGEVIGKADTTYTFVANAVAGTLSDPVVLRFSGMEDKIFAYPNPVDGEVTISLYSRSVGQVDIRITDITGRTLMEQRGSPMIGGQSVTRVDCSRLTPGMYFARVTLGGNSHVIKIEKR